MNALKAQWIVKAGLFPGHIDDSFSKSWQYTSQMYEKDTDKEIYNAMMDQAHSYARSLSDPRLVNCVTIEFIWNGDHSQKKRPVSRSSALYVGYGLYGDISG
jgi:hypothetical protein